jgi:hypothetical protein
VITNVSEKCTGIHVFENRPTSNTNLSCHLSSATANYSACQEQEVHVTMEMDLNRQKIAINIKQEGNEDVGLLGNDIV